MKFNDKLLLNSLLKIKITISMNCVKKKKSCNTGIINSRNFLF